MGPTRREAAFLRKAPPVPSRKGDWSTQLGDSPKGHETSYAWTCAHKDAAVTYSRVFMHKADRLRSDGSKLNYGTKSPLREGTGGAFLRKAASRLVVPERSYSALGPAATTSALMWVYFLKFSTKLAASFLQLAS